MTLSLRAGKNTVTVDLDFGNISSLSLAKDNWAISPLHTASWLDDQDIITNTEIPSVERRLSGDFFCAPFGMSDIEDSPIHGWSANSSWSLMSKTHTFAAMRLNKLIMGASIEKEITLENDSPLLYQRHIIRGGSGKLTFAHHPMVHFDTTARFFCSPKQLMISASNVLEDQRNKLETGVICRTITEFPSVDGHLVNLTKLPIGNRHEDFVSFSEAPSSSIGWTGIWRKAENDLIFFVKNPKQMPLTMTWHSNGGRDYAPWNGKHSNVIGIEDGIAAGELGHKAALRDNVYSQNGIPTYIDLSKNRKTMLSHVTGAIPWPSGWSELRDISIVNNRLVLVGDDSTSIELPFKAKFLD